MFDQLKSMGALAALLKDKDRIRETGERVMRELEDARILGQAGSGAVRVTATGRGRIVEVALDPAMLSGAAVSDESRAFAEQLVQEAANDAIEKAQALVKERVAKAAEELGLPDLPGMENLLGA